MYMDPSQLNTSNREIVVGNVVFTYPDACDDD